MALFLASAGGGAYHVRAAGEKRTTPMSPARRRAHPLHALLLLPALLVWIAASPSRRDPSTPLPLNVWIWSTGPRIDTEAVRCVVADGAQTPFVKAGTFHVVQGRIEYRPELMRGVLPVGAYRLVYSFEPAVVRSLEAIGAAELGGAIAGAFRADSAMLDVQAKGVQVDLDCPTRLLPLYAEALHAVRAGLPAGTELSTTTLLTWLDAPAFEGVLDEVDFHVPMAFGYCIPQRVEERTRIADLDHVLGAVAASDRLGKPYWIGLGAYGYVLSFAADGKLEHVHGKADPREVPSLCVRATEAGDLTVVSPLSLHGIEVPAGRTLQYDRIGVGALQDWLSELRRRAGPQCRGAVLFRLAGKDDPLALTPTGFRALFQGSPTFAPVLRVEGEGSTLRVVLANEGPDDGAFHPDACRVTLRLKKGRFVSAVRGGFDTHVGQLGDRPASIPRSDRVLLTADGLAGEEALRSGPIVVELPFEGELVGKIEGPRGSVELGPIRVERLR